MMIRDGETLDELRLAGLKIIQAAGGYRFSLDPVLLCAFAEIAPGERVADLGTGSGIIPLLLAQRSNAGAIVGVERLSALAERARRSVALNGLQQRVTIVDGDLRQDHDELPPQAFDVVLANPPYRRPGTGRVAPGMERAAARHELAGGLDDFLVEAVRLLRDGGRFYVVYLAERLADLLEQMRHRQLEPKRLRCVHGRGGEAARMVLVEGRKRGGPGVRIEPPLCIREGEEYSPEVLALYEGES